MRFSIFSLAFLALALPAIAQLRGPTNQILIPAASSVQGANGTFFRSDVTLTNLRDTAQQVQLTWVPQIAQTLPPGVPPQLVPVTVTMPAHSGIASEDFVTNYLKQSGLGAILIKGVTSTNELDPNALLFATARIWTPQVGTTGTTSQSFPVVPTGAINAAAQVLILGLHLDQRYRVNVGIVNLDPVSFRSFDIYQNTDNPNLAPLLDTTVTIGPMSVQQIPLTLATSTVLQVIIAPHAGTDPHLWVAYGSSIDNVTGDAWSNLAMPLLQ